MFYLIYYPFRVFCKLIRPLSGSFCKLFRPISGSLLFDPPNIWVFCMPSIVRAYVHNLSVSGIFRATHCVYYVVFRILNQGNFAFHAIIYHVQSYNSNMGFN